MHFIVLLFCIFWITIVTIQTMPPDELDEIVVRYMEKFGYIESTPEALVTKEQFENGVKLMQEFADIPATGILDKKTKELTQVHRCGVKDIQNINESCREMGSTKSYQLNGDGWSKNEIRYYLLNSTEYLEESTIHNILQKAFLIWQKASGLNFYEAVKQLEADIVITFFRGSESPPGVPNIEFDGPGFTMAHTSTQEINNTKSAYILLDDDEKWVDESDKEKGCSGVGFLTIIVHELGHALGLGHTCTYGSVMNPYFGSNNPNIDLGYADALGMYDLYVGSGKFGEIKDIPKPNPIDFPPNPNGRLCDGNFDAALSRYDELYIFRGKVVWRLWHNMLLGGRSFWIRELFQFPIEIKNIDAAYERKTDGKIIFFTGNRYWIFDYIYPFINQSLSISAFGFPRSIQSIDAALSWAEDGKTYFFKDDMYWCYNEILKKMEDGYPRSVKKRKSPIRKFDAAASFRNGSTYVFKGRRYWEMEKSGNITKPKNPYPLLSNLMKCQFD